MNRSVFLATVLVCGMATGCSQVPLSVDTSTYVFHKARVEEQQKKKASPLVGIYRVAFIADHVVEKPEQAKAINGDWQVACLERGPDLDCISLSGYTGFGPSSDQGASFSVNLQGATLWSFPLKMLSVLPNAVRGKASGLLYTDGPRDASLSKLGNSFLRILVEPTEAQRAAHEVQRAAGARNTRGGVPPPPLPFEVYFLSALP